MTDPHPYPIGSPGKKWGDAEKAAWLERASIKRSYRDDVLEPLAALEQRFEVFSYGALSYDPARYPLYAVKTRHWDASKPIVLITGGVHGYETSGVHGALQFLDQRAESYRGHFNILVAPCVSPWGYETINRWNPQALDPNRSFRADGQTEEAAAFIKLLKSLDGDILAHIDLHETTDTDESEFRPALAARDGLQYVEDTVPDGFYLVGDTENPQAEFQRAIIEAVSRVTHIAPADSAGRLINVVPSQPGVINYPVKSLGLCNGVTNCRYGTTTEVYPDSPLVTSEQCNDAQVVSVTSGLDYILEATQAQA